MRDCARLARGPGLAGNLPWPLYGCSAIARSASSDGLRSLRPMGVGFLARGRKAIQTPDRHTPFLREFGMWWWLTGFAMPGSARERIDGFIMGSSWLLDARRRTQRPEATGRYRAARKERLVSRSRSLEDHSRWKAHETQEGASRSTWVLGSSPRTTVWKATPTHVVVARGTRSCRPRA